MRLLVAVDGSSPAHLAATFAMRMARECRGLEVVLLAVEDEGAAGQGEAAVAKARAMFEEDGIPHHVEVAQGKAAEVIVRRAQENACDFIVMGARGVGMVRQALLGSVSSEVLKNATVPVTIVQ